MCTVVYSLTLRPSYEFTIRILQLNKDEPQVRVDCDSSGVFQIRVRNHPPVASVNPCHLDAVGFIVTPVYVLRDPVDCESVGYLDGRHNGTHVCAVQVCSKDAGVGRGGEGRGGRGGEGRGGEGREGRERWRGTRGGEGREGKRRG